MERDKNRVGYCTLVIAASGWIILGAAITYLELKRNAEINPLAVTVNFLIKEVEELKAEIDSMKNSTSFRFAQLESRSDVVGTPIVDDYYDDGFDGEYDEDVAEEEATGDTGGGKGGSSGTARRRRSSGSTLKKYSGASGDVQRDRRNIFGTNPVIAGSPNAILRQNWVKPGNFSRGKVEAEIIVDTQDAQGGRPEEVIRPDSDDRCCDNPILAHFEGDISSVSHVKTTHYQGNHRVYQNGVISEWEPAEWMKELKLLSNFNVDAGRSEVSVKEESQGVYFVYAQVFYADPHDTAGFGIYVNHENVFQCTVTSLHHPETQRHRTKSNSCFTGGLVKLTPGDKVTLREIEGTRSTVMHAPKSFLGMFRVQAV